MKTLNDSGLFKEMQGKIVKELQNVIIERDKVDIVNTEAFATMKKRLNFATKGKILNYISRGDIIFVYNQNINLPRFFNTFCKIEGKRLVAVVDLTNYANKNSNGDIDIFPKTLYALAQNATVALELVNNWNRYTMNYKILNNLMLSYSKLTSKIFDKIFAINIDEFKSDLVHFLMAKFFLVNMCGKPNNETTNSLAYKACANNSSLEVILDTENDFDGTQYQSIFNLFTNIKTIRGIDVSIRSFVENWVRMYGETTLLGLDYLPHFMAALFSASIAGNLNKEYLIESVAGKFVSKTFIEFSRIMK